MDQNEAKVKFRQSDELFQLGQHEDSLRVLYELNEAFPNTKNILFPIARNLFAIGRYNDALSICEKLIISFNYPKAVELKRKIQQGKVGSSSAFPTSGVPGLDNDDSFGEGEIQGVHLSDIGLDDVDTSGIESLLAVPTATSNASVSPIPVNTGSDMGKWLLLGVAIFGLLLVVGVFVAFLSSGAADMTNEDALNGLGAGLMALIYLAAFFIGWVATTTIGYITLLFLGALPEHGLVDNLINIGKIALIMSLVSLIPFVGGFVGIFIFVSKYEIGFSGCLVYLLVGFFSFLLMSFLIFLLLFALGASLSALDVGTPALYMGCIPSI
ncbi:MAG: hypothetical protein VCD00_03775 [Candidatus Hydrogenedentota bacterium]